VYSYIAGIIHI